MSGRAAIILAAGMGTRMRSTKPKVLHEVAGRPMVDWSISLARSVGCDPIIVVRSEAQHELKSHVEKSLGEHSTVVQAEPLGTAHAVRAAEEALSGHTGAVVVLYGDTPLIQAASIEQLLETVEQSKGVGVLGFESASPGAYGRLIVENGRLERIVEAKDATPSELAVSFCNSGVMAAPGESLFSLLAKVSNDNAKGEYYLTDIVGLAKAAKLATSALACDEADVLGVNSRVELAAAEAAFQARARSEALVRGVTMVAPETVWFSHDTVVEADVTIEPNVVFDTGVVVHAGATVRAFSHLEGATVHSGSVVGPYARLRPGAVLDEDTRVGNFVEVKNTRMGKGAKANHLAYLGDGDVGPGANIGAGTIFCNYDGFFKHKTEIGAGAFVGSNSALVAPVSIGAGAFVGSGSVVTRNVPDDALMVARGKAIQKEGWALSFRTQMKAKKEESR